MREEDLIDNYLARVARDWISYHSVPEDGRADRKDLYDPFGVVFELVQHSPLHAWDFIRFVLSEDREERSLDILSAGPLEDLISIHGSSLIEHIEDAAKEDPRLRSLLAGVWQFGTPGDIWARIEQARGDAAPFPSK
jgi:hypothetical protein